MPLDPSTFNLQPNFPIAGVADLIAQRPYKEALMREAQQKQLLEGLQGFGTGVNALVQRRLAMAQALAAGRALQGILQGASGQGGDQTAAPASVASAPSGATPPTLSTGTAPSDVSHGTFPDGSTPQGVPGGLPLGIMSHLPPQPIQAPQAQAPPASAPVPIQMPPLTAGSAPPQPPASISTSQPSLSGNVNDLAMLSYDHDPAEILKAFLPYITAQKERQVQTRTQDVDIYKSQMENLKSANTNAVEMAKAQIEAATKAKQINVEEANSYRTLLGNLEQKQTELNKQASSALGIGLITGSHSEAVRALDEMQRISDEIKQVQGHLGMSGQAGLPDVGKSIKHPSGATITRTK